MTVHVAEFLYRGRDPSSGEPNAWHVILADTITGPDGRSQYIEGQPLTPDQATALGWDLTAITGDINTQLMTERDALTTERDALRAERDALRAEVNKRTR